MNIAINGFGRIGRQALRIILEKHPDLSVVLINDLTDDETLAHLFQFDSTYGRFPGTVEIKNGALVINGKTIQSTAEKDPEKLPMKDLKVDVVLECTGAFRKREQLELHRKAGAKKVLLSAPAKDEIDGTFVLGVNEKSYDSKTMHIVSNASCTTNCLAPMVKVIHEHCTIEQGFMTTIHSYTNDQRILDFPHKDLRRARSAAENVIPTSTGAAKAIGLVIPELKGKLDGISIRVPTPTGSITDFTCVVAKETTAEALNAAFKKAAEGALKNILGYEERELVLKDYVGDPRSSIIDAPNTKVHTENGVTMVKTLAWYDNEWGYSNRLVELAKFIAR
ncbi:type I glyceraldehyde-3-phosphate dehydrogenase [Candidatus Peregrinibacteria bacterium CG10_big_fil_rev_8_21_14_0_10_55_24]|nr:MAG: type I glyceraldehyde-3-phosphate dehydrogenase [Candidatus Peregrinibacteria bacterium CG10_big_fil_rev_8_21_14_0_10_55_24]